MTEMFCEKKILVISSIANEGKSFVPANMALSLANSGKKVVLLNVDLPNPKSSTIFRLKEEKWIFDYLDNNANLW